MQQFTQLLLYGTLPVIHTVLPCPAHHAAACKAAHATARERGGPGGCKGCYKLPPGLGRGTWGCSDRKQCWLGSKQQRTLGKGLGGWRTGYKRGARDGEEAARQRAGDSHTPTHSRRQAGGASSPLHFAGGRAWLAGRRFTWPRLPPHDNLPAMPSVVSVMTAGRSREQRMGMVWHATTRPLHQQSQGDAGRASVLQQQVGPAWPILAPASNSAIPPAMAAARHVDM